MFIDPTGLEAGYSTEEYKHYRKKWNNRTSNNIFQYATYADQRAREYAFMEGLEYNQPNESDAFRHFTWMLELRRGYGGTIAQYVGNYHELIGSPENFIDDSDYTKVRMRINQETLMDFQNNAVGIAAARQDGCNYTDAYYLFQSNIDQIITDASLAYAFFGLEEGYRVGGLLWQIEVEFDMSSNTMKIFENLGSGGMDIIDPTKYKVITFGIQPERQKASHPSR